MFRQYSAKVRPADVWHENEKQKSNITQAKTTQQQQQRQEEDEEERERRLSIDSDSSSGDEHVLDEDGDRVLRDVEVTTTVQPPAAILPLVIVGIIIAIILLLLAIIFGVLAPLGYLNITPANVTTSTTLAPGQSASTAVHGTSTTLPAATTTTTQPTTTTPYVPTNCTGSDIEPFLCLIAADQGLCHTEFAMANCCATCGPFTCFDADEDCFKIKLYGLCANQQYRYQCCASCML